MQHLRTQDWLRLVALAAIWGGSFVFQRIAVPVLGPWVTTELRVAIGGIAVWSFVQLQKESIHWSANWKRYLIIGTVNSAVPFTLFAFAARTIPTAYSAVLNSTAPLFGAVFGALWLSETFTLRRFFSLIAGAAGVALVARVGEVQNLGTAFWFSIFGCLFAASCYALNGIYVKQFGAGLTSRGIAAASQLMAALVLLPFALAHVPASVPSVQVVLCVLGLGLFCSGLAYLIFFRLMGDLGPSRALTVTFLIPIFGCLWGYLFLGEGVTLTMALGVGLVLLGTRGVLSKS